MKYMQSIKFRLTLWYMLVMGLLLLFFSAAAFMLLSRSLRKGLDDTLKAHALAYIDALDINDGTIKFGESGISDDVVLLYGAGPVAVYTRGDKDVVALVAEAMSSVASTEASYLTIAKSRNGEEYRLYRAPFSVDTVEGVIVAGQSMERVSGLLITFERIFVIVVLITLLLAGVGGHVLAARVLQPIERIRLTADQIGESDLGKRIPWKGDDELGLLAGTINRMIARLENAFAQQKRFTADASHELRTPLSIIQAEATLTLRKKRRPEEYRDAIALISQEAEHMSSITDNLLRLARHEAPRDTATLEAVCVPEVLAEVVVEMAPLCQEKGIDLIRGSMDGLSLRVDITELKQVFMNLLHNAIRYTPEGGTVSVSLSREGRHAVISVKDTGIGIPPEHLAHIFDRFYRVDKSRSRAEGGSGLGLSIARQIVESWGGTIKATSAVGAGSVFSVCLDAVEPVDA